MAFYSQLVVFSTVLMVYTSLISWLGIVSLVMAVAAAVVWWLGVVRDHQKDDVKYLQGHVVMVHSFIHVTPVADASKSNASPFLTPHNSHEAATVQTTDMTK